MLYNEQEQAPIFKFLEEAIYNNGFIKIPVRKQVLAIIRKSCNSHDEPKSSLNHEILEIALNELHFLNTLTSVDTSELTPKIVKKLELSIDSEDDKNYYVLVNFAKLIHLPCENINEELTEVSKFFKLHKNIAQNYPTFQTHIQIANRYIVKPRSKSSPSTNYEVTLLAKPLCDDMNVSDFPLTQINKDFQSLIENSPILSSMCTSIAQTFISRKKWCWINCSDDPLFENETPFKATFSEYRKSKRERLNQ